MALGAFAAHGLDLSTEAGRKAREWLQTGSQYQIIHALAIVAVVVLARNAMLNGRVAIVAQCLFSSAARSFPGRCTPSLSEGRVGSAWWPRSAAPPSSWAG